MNSGLCGCNLRVGATSTMALLFAVAPASGQDPPRDSRYQLKTPTVFDAKAGSDGLKAFRPGVGDALIQLASYGEFARVQEGETIELAALRLGHDSDRLIGLNSVEPGHLFSADAIICVEFGHRLLPDESIDFLAGLYETDPETLRALNHLDPGEDPPAWSRVQIPCSLTTREQKWIGQALFFRVVTCTTNVLLDESGGLRVTDFSVRTHRVAAGETWESIADDYSTTADRLRAFRTQDQLLISADEGSSALDPLRAGQTITVGSTVRFPRDVALEDLVLTIEYSMRADLDDVLVLNDLAEPDEMLDLDQLFLPSNGFNIGLVGFGCTILLGNANAAQGVLNAPPTAVFLFRRSEKRRSPGG